MTLISIHEPNKFIITKNSIMSVKPSINTKSVLKEIIHDEESILPKTSDVIKSIYKKHQ